MRFKIKRIFTVISLSIVGLILFCNLTINAETTPLPQGKQEQCSILPSATVKKISKEGKESTETKSIQLQLSNVIKDQSVLSNPIEVRLGDRIRVTINGLSSAIKDKDIQFDPKQLVLQLNGYPLKGIQGNIVAKDELIFQLTHLEESRNEWNTILGAAWNDKRDVELTVGCPDGQRIPNKDSKSSILTIILWQSVRGYIILIPIGLLGFFLLRKDFRDAIRISGISSNRVFSLARFQLAWWSYLIFFTFLGMFAITGSYTNIITPQSMILLGLSAGTTIGSSVIDSSENRQLTPNQKTTLENLDSRFKLLQELKYHRNRSKQIDFKTKIDNEIANLNTEIAALNVHINQTTPLENANSKWVRLNHSKDFFTKIIDGKISKLQIDEELANIKKDMNDIEQQSKNFFNDILTNPSGEINLHRYQIFIWTLVLGLVFIYQVLTTFKMPEFDTNLLALQGISSGTFLALKSQEKPLTDKTD